MARKTPSEPSASCRVSRGEQSVPGSRSGSPLSGWRESTRHATAIWSPTRKPRRPFSRQRRPNEGQRMWSPRVNLFLVLVAVLAASPALSAELSPDAINSAEPSNKSLSKDNATPAGVRLQVLLDRAHFSPGEIDGKFGENARKALRAYAEAQQLPSADRPTEEVWKALRAA